MNSFVILWRFDWVLFLKHEDTQTKPIEKYYKSSLQAIYKRPYFLLRLSPVICLYHYKHRLNLYYGYNTCGSGQICLAVIISKDGFPRKAVFGLVTNDKPDRVIMLTTPRPTRTQHRSHYLQVISKTLVRHRGEWCLVSPFGYSAIRSLRVLLDPRRFARNDGRFFIVVTATTYSQPAEVSCAPAPRSLRTSRGIRTKGLIPYPNIP